MINTITKTVAIRITDCTLSTKIDPAVGIRIRHCKLKTKSDTAVGIKVPERNLNSICAIRITRLSAKCS